MIEGPQDFHWNRMYPGKRRLDDGRESACLRIQLQLSVILSAAAFLRLLKMENEQSGVGGVFESVGYWIQEMKLAWILVTFWNMRFIDRCLSYSDYVIGSSLDYVEVFWFLEVGYDI